MKHLAADKAKTFQNLRKYLVDPEVTEVVIDEASAAVAALETDKDGIRFDLTTSAIEVVSDTNFFNLDVVASNTEVPYQAMNDTRTDMWYTVNQDYYGRIPITTLEPARREIILNFSVKNNSRDYVVLCTNSPSR